MAAKQFKLKDVENNSRTNKILSGKYPILLDYQVFKYVFKHLEFGNVLSEAQKVYFPDNIHYIQFITDIHIVTSTGHIIILEAFLM